AAAVQTRTLAAQAISLLAGPSLTVHIAATKASTSCTTSNNTTSVSATNEPSTVLTDNSAGPVGIVVQCPAIHVTKSADATPVSAGTGIGYTVTVSNAGPGNATGVVLTDNLPGGNVATPVTWSLGTATPTGSFALGGSAGSQTLSLTSSTLASGASESVHITAPTSSTSCGTYNNSASVATGNDG